MNGNASEVPGPSVHVVPVKLLVGVWAVLMFLTFVTVAATWVNLGELNLAIALAIATVKATIVALYFMHLRWDKPMNAVVFVTAIGFVLLFLLILILDTKSYAPEMIPDHAPAIHR